MKILNQNHSGSILLEGVLVVFSLVLAIVFNLELFRRMNYETLVQQAAFMRARDKVMGVKTERSKKKICELFKHAFNEGQKLCDSMGLKDKVSSLDVRRVSEDVTHEKVFKSFSEEENIRGIIASAHIDYKQLMKFEWKNPNNHWKKEIKQDLEITKQCPYPTSSY